MDKISLSELRRRVKIAKMMPGLAHLRSFGLVLYSIEESPRCSLCGGVDAPIVEGKHLHRKFCLKKDSN